jgi:benzoyl-CoA reductase/2-hydroxyglutaryl-CoA dehydratase subunit BcrC/BadD/HgdB
MKKKELTMPTELTSNKSGRINTIIRTCKLLNRMSQGNPEVPLSHSLYYRMLAEYYSRIVKAQEEGRFIAAHTVWFPVELLYAMDIVPMHTEITAWMTALFTGNCKDLLSAAAAAGIAPETCSPYRVLTGAFTTGAIPRPNVVLSSNLICDNNAKIGELIRHIVKSPGFFVDCPFRRSNLEEAYLKKELEEMVRFMEEQSGQKMNWDKLRENLARADREIELFRRVDDLRRNIPSPFLPQDFLKLFTADCLFAGEPEALGYLEALCSELTEKVNAGRGIAYPEKYRVLSIGIPPILLQGAVERTCREYGVVSVTDPYSCTWEDGRLDAPDPLDNVLRKISMTPSMVFYGPLTDKLTAKVVKSATEHKVDGAIFYAHIGCRQSAPMIRLIKEALNSIDIPILILDCDIVDVTVTPEEDLCHKLRQFFELLEDR